MSDPYRLERFVQAQAAVYADVVAELTAGRKRTHWMWFIFPQIAGLGRSATAQHFAISSLAEARAYAAHPVLGPRLMQCAALALDAKVRDAHTLFGSPDDLKFHSSMTLFALADPAAAVYDACLARYFNGKADTRSVELARET
ncbi:DUF1810 domain-containing protein [Schauerella aestuarii]|uniref:DUF1810 domain-containing protein n=1 Tax=Schauerella aestuarii TaxID=2511204 RepID=UPI00136E0567|nr:DUF1810 domain-containing protein [Achromobacter aestuarii]MYZ41550.1 DUF1810 domain-containing protein [Achromobacter aestuarii]